MAGIRYGNLSTGLVGGRTVFEHADALGVPVPSSCGRLAHCHECVVEIRCGMEALSPKTEAEFFLKGSYRLACQAVVQDPDLEVEFALLRRLPQILTGATEKAVEIEPEDTFNWTALSTTYQKAFEATHDRQYIFRAEDAKQRAAEMQWQK